MKTQNRKDVFISLPLQIKCVKKLLQGYAIKSWKQSRRASRRFTMGNNKKKNFQALADGQELDSCWQCPSEALWAGMAS